MIYGSIFFFIFFFKFKLDSIQFALGIRSRTHPFTSYIWYWVTEEREKILLKFKLSDHFCLKGIKEGFLDEVIIKQYLAEQVGFLTSSISVSEKGKSGGL